MGNVGVVLWQVRKLYHAGSFSELSQGEKNERRVVKLG